MAKVGIVMGSDSDLPIMSKAAEMLDKFGIDYEVTVISAHRMPDVFFDYAKTAKDKGFKVIIAGAGGAAHLPGMCAAIFPLPVIGVPIHTKTLSGVDSLYSIVQMPGGIPVATVAINGAQNAGILAAKMLAVSDDEMLKKIEDYAASLKDSVMAKKEKIENLIIDLRDNGGGLLDQAIAMADCFVPEGKIITTQDQKIQLFNKVFQGSKGKKEKYNIVLLMNEYSASASEVFAAALRENDLATIIGTKTYGKGTIQSVSSLQTGGAIKYTMGFYLTPQGNNINKVGLTPDIYVENSKEKMSPDHFGTFVYDTVYQEGDSGKEVKMAKQILEFMGLYQGEINEEFDRDLYYAVYAFQTQADLYPYGVLDLTTQLQLRNRLGMSEREHDDQMAEAYAYFGIQTSK